MIDNDTILTIVIGLASGFASFGVMYFLHLIKVKEQIAKLEERIMDKDVIQERITVLEERDRQKQKFFDFLDDQVMSQFLRGKKDK